MDIEYIHAILATIGMFVSFIWGKYLTKEEIISDVIVKTISSLADNHYVMVQEGDDGEKYLIPITMWLETLQSENNEKIL